MTPFDLVEPRSLRDAAAILGDGGSTARPVAGGTAIMLMMKMGLLRPARLVSLRGIERRYFGIGGDGDGALRIGAMATLSALEHSPEIGRRIPVLARALRTLSSVRVRNVATLGGHLAHADPHMDLPPLLVALDAGVTTVAEGGGRTFPLAQLYRGYLETTLAAGELIAEVTVPLRASWQAAYLKCTARSADDWPALGMAVALDAEGGLVRDARIVVGAATDTPVRLTGAEGELRGQTIAPAVLRRASETAMAEAPVVGDAHGSAAYKRELVGVYVARAVRAALHGGDGR